MISLTSLRRFLVEGWGQGIFHPNTPEASSLYPEQTLSVWKVAGNRFLKWTSCFLPAEEWSSSGLRCWKM